MVVIANNYQVITVCQNHSFNQQFHEEDITTAEYGFETKPWVPSTYPLCETAHIWLTYFRVEGSEWMKHSEYLFEEGKKAIQKLNLLIFWKEFYSFPLALLRCNCHITLYKFKVYSCWFDTFMNCKMIATTVLATTSIHSHSYHFFFVVRTFKAYSIGNI